MTLSKPHIQQACAACALLLLTSTWLGSMTGSAQEHTRVRSISGLPLVAVPASRYRPFFPVGATAPEIEVSAFQLMTRPVTNAEFLAFVVSDRTYQRDRISRTFADEPYLSHWAGVTDLGPEARPQQPVTHVSWFAAKAFCESRGLRLPTEAEWELVAAASETLRDSRSDPRFRDRLLAWYATPNAVLPEVPHGPANAYGVSDLHGVVWEWVLDFNNAPGVADAEADRFCGGGALAADESTDYAAFMRFSLRSSLKAAYTTANLGFRCASDTKGGKAQPAPAASNLPAQSVYHLQVSLTDQRGAALTLASLRGRPVLLAMFYASCTTICPVLIEQLRAIDSSLSPEARAQVQVLLVSLDPAHDSVERLAELAKQHRISDDRWHFTRTSEASVRETAAALGAAYRRQPDGTIGHSASIFLLDRSGVVAAQLDGPRGDASEFLRTLTQTIASGD